MKLLSNLIRSSAVASLLGCSMAFASGFSILEQSTVGLGRSLAGMTAETDDPGSLYFNPATGAFHEKKTLMAGMHYIDTYARFHDDGKTNSTGTESGHITGPANVPNFNYIHPIADGITLNLTMSATSGTATSYSPYWRGRYFATETSIAVLEMTPSLSWKITDNFSVGAGFIAQYCETLMKRKLDLSAAGMKDGELKLDGDSWAYGLSLGALYKPFDGTRLGLSYRSSMTHDTDMKAKFRANKTVLGMLGYSPSDTASMKLHLPSTINFGIQQDITDKLTLMSDIAWSEWSCMDDMNVWFKKARKMEKVPMHWKDSWRFSLGGQYKLNEKWTLRCGATYDRTPIPNEKRRTPPLPDVNRYWFSIGAGYKVSENMTINGAFTRLLFHPSNGDATDTQGHRISGEYTGHTNIYSLAMTYTW